jgi:hypothetical protein
MALQPQIGLFLILVREPQAAIGLFLGKQFQQQQTELAVFTLSQILVVLKVLDSTMALKLL